MLAEKIAVLIKKCLSGSLNEPKTLTGLVHRDTSWEARSVCPVPEL